MKKFLFLIILFIGQSSILIFNSQAEGDKPDTVNVGIYVTSIHDVDFKQKEFSINLWLWLKYKRTEFDFTKNLEVPMSKSFEKSYATIDTLEDGTIYMLMKLHCLMKGTWQINQFPFDHQKLRFSIENSEFDSQQLVFTADTLGKHYGKYFLYSWEKDSFNISTENKEYETAFGDPDASKPLSEYSSYKVTVVVHRESWELFSKIFLGMYISFLIASLCFYLHNDNSDAKLALSVGALFAVIGNKYIIDSSLPESNSFTLVDVLHAITLFYIFLVIASSIYTLNLAKAGKIDESERKNKWMGLFLIVAYILSNAWFIYNALHTDKAT